MTTWSYNGVPLSTYGVVTMIDEDLDVPEKRDGNIVIPFHHGSSFAEKYYSERKISFGIGMRVANAAALETLIDSLRGNLSSRALKVLSQTREDGSVRTAYAAVERQMSIKRETAIFARMVIEFILPFPFFRLSTAIADNTTTINANPKAMTVTNPGTVEECDPIITLTGPLQNTVMTNPVNGCILTYGGIIPSPRVVTIQTVNREYVATNDLGANAIGNVSHSGASAWMVIEKGANPLSIADDTHTTGTVKVSFNAPFL